MRSLFPNNGHFGESASYMPQKSFPVRELLTNNYVGILYIYIYMYIHIYIHIYIYIYIYTAHLTLPETNSPPQKRHHIR